MKLHREKACRGGEAVCLHMHVFFIFVFSFCFFMETRMMKKQIGQEG